MNPIKYKQIIKETAEELGVSDSIVSQVVNYYYKSIHKELNSLDNASIKVNNLGNFYIKRKQLYNKIRMTKEFINKLEKKENLSMRNFCILVEKREQLIKYNNMLEQLVEEDNKKKQVLIKKKIYESNSNLEK